jgi:hypothetical protein
MQFVLEMTISSDLFITIVKEFLEVKYPILL